MDHFYLYILRTSANTLYIGQTNNLEKRLNEHRNKKGKSSKYVRSFESFELVYTETYASRADAMRRERALKRLTRAKKESLIENDQVSL